MNRIITSFLIRLIVIVGLVFLSHLFILHSLELPLFDNKIILAYTINTGFAILIFVILFLFRHKFKDQLGFLFIAGGMVKFVLFFIFFYLPYLSDDVISKAEVFAFFTPYAITLIVEIFSLSKWMNKME